MRKPISIENVSSSLWEETEQQHEAISRACTKVAYVTPYQHHGSSSRVKRRPPVPPTEMNGLTTAAMSGSVPSRNQAEQGHQWPLRPTRAVHWPAPARTQPPTHHAVTSPASPTHCTPPKHAPPTPPKPHSSGQPIHSLFPPHEEVACVKSLEAIRSPRASWCRRCTRAARSARMPRPQSC